MSRIVVRFAIASVCAFIGAGCAGGLHAVLPGTKTVTAPAANPSPDLSKKNYVATYPVAETPNYIASGSDGNLWFTTSHYVVRITTGGTETYFSNSGGFATHIAAGAPGALWFTDLNNSIGKIALDGTITTYAVPGASTTFDIAKGPDGNMWFTERGSQSIGKITAGGSSTLYHIPSGATPIGITAGPDGALWFSASGGPTGEEFGKATTAGAITEYPIASGTPGSPGAMTQGPDGELYATDSVGGVFAVTTAGVSTYYPTTFTSNFENGIAVGPDKKIWVSPGDAADDLTEFNTKTHVFGRAAMVPGCGPSSPGIPRGLTLGPDGDMWFVTEGCAYVGAYEESISSVGIRLTGESPFNDPNYGFELGYFNGLTSTTSQTVVLSAGETVQFQNVDTTLTHTASFLGDATASGAPWPSSFDGTKTRSPAGTPIGTSGFSTGPLKPGKKSPLYETGMPGFYMFGCAFHYNPDEMRTVIVVR